MKCVRRDWKRVCVMGVGVHPEVRKLLTEGCLSVLAAPPPSLRVGFSPRSNPDPNPRLLRGLKPTRNDGRIFYTGAKLKRILTESSSIFLVTILGDGI
jgi:hypothetical protein